MAKNKTEQQGAKSKKKWIIAAAVVLVLAAAVAGNSDTYDNIKQDQQTEQSAQSTEPDTQDTEQAVDTPEPEANASAKVDALALEAKAAAAEGVTDEQRDEAIAFIVDHYPAYYADNETMEQAMAYGFWLEYAYKDDEASRDYAELGMDVAQAVKYVYRGAEEVEDDATQENLRQIKETLEKLGYNVE